MRKQILIPLSYKGSYIHKGRYAFFIDPDAENRVTLAQKSFDKIAGERFPPGHVGKHKFGSDVVLFCAFNDVNNSQLYTDA